MLFNNVYFQLVNSTVSSCIYVDESKRFILKDVSHSRYRKFGIYQREKNILSYLNRQHYQYAPILVSFDDQRELLMMTYCGQKLLPSVSLDQLDIARQLYEAFEQLKLLGIVHNDLFSDQILVCQSHIYIIDYGWSVSLDYGNIYDDNIYFYTRQSRTPTFDIDNFISRFTNIYSMQPFQKYCNKSRTVDSSQSEEPRVTQHGDLIDVTGYQQFSINQSGFIHKIAGKYTAVDEFLNQLTDKNLSLGDLGCSNGYICYLAHFAGFRKIYGYDHDVQCLNVIAYINKLLRINTITPKYFDIGHTTITPHDIVVAMALIHWIYSCTSQFGSLYRIIEYLSNTTKQYLLIEWIDPSDISIKQFLHLSYNPKIQTEPYTFDNFMYAVKDFFTEIKPISSGGSRVVYLCSNPKRKTIITNEPKINDLNIIKAIYGHDKKIIDVTEIVQQKMSDNFVVSNQLFTDPTPGVRKELTIYIANGKSCQIMENEIVNWNVIKNNINK